MTLLIIVLVIVLIAGGCEFINKTYAKNRYKERTITNVELEKQLKTEWICEVDKKLNELNPPHGELFSTFISLYDFYKVPLFGLTIGNINDAERKFERDKNAAQADEWAYISFLYHDYLNDCKKDDIVPQVSAQLCSDNVTRDAQQLAWAIYQYYATCDCCSAYDETCLKEIGFTREKLSTIVDELKLLYKNTTIPDAMLPSEKLHCLTGEIYNKDLHRGTGDWRRYYNDLITLLTRRSLKEKGFNLSRDGVHESEWQEREKQNKKFKKLRDDYPWNYDSDDKK